MAQGLRKIDPLVFDENIADNWTKFKHEWRIYSNAGLSTATEKVQAYTFLNLAGPVFKINMTLSLSRRRKSQRY